MDQDSHCADILVVEDNQINRYLVTNYLHRCGYAYQIASNGQEAVEEYQAKKPSLVFMDIQMPVLDGLLATKEIRRLEESTGQRTPIIAVTARAQFDDEFLCLEAGMNDYVSKPMKMESLRDMLDKWLPARAAAR